MEWNGVENGMEGDGMGIGRMGRLCQSSMHLGIFMKFGSGINERSRCELRVRGKVLSMCL